MKRNIIIALFFVMLMTVAAYGDEYYEFVHMTCVKEVGFLEIQSVGMSNIGAYVKEGYSPNTNNLKHLEKKYDLYLLEPGNTINQNCALKDSTVRIEVRRDKTRTQGQCSANPSSYISLWINNVKFINSVKFGADNCFPPYIRKIIYQDRGVSTSLSFVIEGSDAFIMEHYIASWELPRINKPISDFYIEGILNKNKERLEKTIKRGGR